MALFDISASVGIISLREDNEAARLSETDRSCVFRSGKVGVCLERSLCAKEGGVSEAGHCPGPADYQCCFGRSNTISTTSTPKTSETVGSRITPELPASTDGSNGVNTGIIVGSVASAVALAMLGIVLGICIRLRRRGSTPPFRGSRVPEEPKVHGDDVPPSTPHNELPAEPRAPRCDCQRARCRQERRPSECAELEVPAQELDGSTLQRLPEKSKPADLDDIVSPISDNGRLDASPVFGTFHGHVMSVKMAEA